MADTSVENAVEWSQSGGKPATKRRAMPIHIVSGSNSSSDASNSTNLTPGRKRTSRSSASSRVDPVQSYEEFIRLQNIELFMMAERERGVRVSVSRTEHELFVAVLQQEREERLRLGGWPTPESTPLSRRPLEFNPPPVLVSSPAVSLSAALDSAGSSAPDTAPATSTAVEPSLPCCPSIKRAEGTDTMPEGWRDQFRGIHLRPAPSTELSDGFPRKEAQCCSLQ